MSEDKHSFTITGSILKNLRLCANRAGFSLRFALMLGIQMACIVCRSIVKKHSIRIYDQDGKYIQDLPVPSEPKLK